MKKILPKVLYAVVGLSLLLAASCLTTTPLGSSADEQPVNGKSSAEAKASEDATTPSGVPTAQVALQTPTRITVPFVQKDPPPKFLGIMLPVYWSKENVELYMPEADALAGMKHSAVGWGIDVQDPALVEGFGTEWSNNKNNLYRQLEQLWLKGYFSFVKIGFSGQSDKTGEGIPDSLREVADGWYDAELIQMAEIYKIWIEQGEGRKAMFAPFQEMNGTWVPYYPADSTPAQRQQDYKDAYIRIFNIFQQVGIQRSQVWWVFGPNGGSAPEDNFEFYYPGDAYVDMVGFASYNFGYCEATVKPDGNDYGNWENYDTIYTPYIQRMQAMAPEKPIIITETGTSGITSKEAREAGQYDYAAKAEWFRINYDYLASQPMVIGIFYFDFFDLGHGVTCDLAIPRDGFTGYAEGVNGGGYKYIHGKYVDNVLGKYLENILP